MEQKKRHKQAIRALHLIHLLEENGRSAHLLVKFCEYLEKFALLRAAVGCCESGSANPRGEFCSHGFCSVAVALRSLLAATP